MTTQTVPQTTNGVDVTRFMETIGAVKQSPEMGKANFRAKNRWVFGTHNRAMVGECQIGGEIQDRRMEPFVHDFDEPPCLLGGDTGANPVEYVLTALTGCVTTSIVLNAAARGITIHSIESTCEGDIDLQGMLALDETVSVGYQGIRMEFKVDADATPEEIEELVQTSKDRSPVFNTVSSPVPIQVTVTESK
ncbi:OsmC family protein [Candidatus Sumerlaeota bacterium]|nr:OsmC family protein [Candidatus Sumerlaeota bacterium]